MPLASLHSHKQAGPYRLRASRRGALFARDAGRNFPHEKLPESGVHALRAEFPFLECTDARMHEPRGLLTRESGRLAGGSDLVGAWGASRRISAPGAVGVIGH